MNIRPLDPKIAVIIKNTLSTLSEHERTVTISLPEDNSHQQETALAIVKRAAKTGKYTTFNRPKVNLQISDTGSKLIADLQVFEDAMKYQDIIAGLALMAKQLPELQENSIGRTAFKDRGTIPKGFLNTSLNTNPSGQVLPIVGASTVKEEEQLKAALAYSRADAEVKRMPYPGDKPDLPYYTNVQLFVFPNTAEDRTKIETAIANHAAEIAEINKPGQAR